MKKQSFLILVSTILLLVAAFTLVECAVAQSDFNAFSGNEIANNQIDGTIGSEWSDAGHVGGVSINPVGTADVWTKNDGTYLYLAVQFTADSDNPWVGIQLGENSSMKANADVALFGNDHYNVNGYVDYYMSSTGGAKADTTQNGVGALNVTSSNLVTVELKKPLNSSDAAGKDINWAVSETQTLIIIWDSNGRGSSGGNTNHYGNGASVDTAMVRTLLINSNSLSESGNPILSNFDTTTTVIVLVIVIVAILVVIVGVRWVRKRGAGKQPTSPQDSANLTMSQA